MVPPECAYPVNRVFICRARLFTAFVVFGTASRQLWRAFDDPILSGLIRQALSVNHDIGIAAMRLEEAKALLRENRQSFLPSGGPAFSYENRRKSEIETSPDQSRQQETYRGAVDSAWEIDLFG